MKKCSQNSLARYFDVVRKKWRVIGGEINNRIRNEGKDHKIKSSQPHKRKPFMSSYRWIMYRNKIKPYILLFLCQVRYNSSICGVKKGRKTDELVITFPLLQYMGEIKANQRSACQTGQSSCCFTEWAEDRNVDATYSEISFYRY